jgi:HD superfamily phosphohydrolase YqeK
MKCRYEKEIFLIKTGSNFSVKKFKNFDRILFNTDQLKHNWKLRTKIENIECKKLKEVILNKKKNEIN